MKPISQPKNSNLMLFTLPPPSSTIEQNRYPIEFVEKIRRTYSNLIGLLIIDPELTKVYMAYSEQSLKEDWDNEDDAYWASYLQK
jgi:hypothetical protein